MAAKLRCLRDINWLKEFRHVVTLVTLLLIRDTGST